MLDLVHAERPEDLVEELVTCLLERARALGAAGALEPALVVVQSLSLESWVTQQVADRLGVAANLRFLLPNRFAHEISTRLLGASQRLRSPLEPPVLTWRILSLLGTAEPWRHHPQLAGYLAGADLRRRFRLARRVADLLDQYLVYRPDWIEAWDAQRLVGLGPSEGWQSELWRRVTAGLPAAERGLVSKLQPIVEALNRPGAAVDRIPRHLALFGISSLPPQYLELIAALSRHSAVTMLLLNPCTQHDWGRIELPRGVDQSAELTDDDMYFVGGNPLLASMARPVRDFVDLVIEAAGDQLRDPRWHDAGEAADGKTLLQWIQHDVRTLTWRRADAADEDARPVTIAAADRSVQVHVCHGPMREVEILHDQLLRLFDADSTVPGLRPDHVAVLVPDIDTYAPYIDAVFGAGLPPTTPGGEPRRIPYTLADRSVAGEHALLRTFAGLLALPDSRFRVDEVLDLLVQPALRVRAGLDEEQVARLKGWIGEAGIRWGRDGAHRAALSLPAVDEHTWGRGLQRLLLGTLLPPDLAGDGAVPLFHGRLPHEGLDGADARTLGAFAAWFDRLCAFADDLRAPRPAAAWRADLSRWFFELCDPYVDRDSAQQLKSALTELERTAAGAAFDEPLDAATVRAWLDAETAASGGRGGNFLAGAVTFGRLVPMRSIPFRVLCVLGLDDASFPRSTPASGFDLMARHPRRGDRSRRSDDRYLFLEMLLAARECLYLSYVGRDARDNTVRPPSVLLAELIDVATEGFIPAAAAGDARAAQRAAMKTHLVTEHPLQPFSERYFDAAAHAPGARLFSYASDWAMAAAAEMVTVTIPPLMAPDTVLPPPEPELLDISIDDLVSFLSSPAAYFCEKRLGLRIRRESGAAAIDEPFELEYELQFAIGDTLVEALDRGREKHVVRTLLREKGLLPHGEPGDALFEGRWAAYVAQRAQRDRRGAIVHESLPVEFTSGGVRVSGVLRGVREQGLVMECGGSKPWPRDRLRLWVQHLLLCLHLPRGVEQASLGLGLEEVLQFNGVEEPDVYLADILRAYRAGLDRPLPFILKCAQEYVKVLLGRTPDDDLALSRAREAWDSNSGYGGSPPSEDRYWKVVMRGLDVDDVIGPEFVRWTRTLLLPLEWAAKGKLGSPAGVAP